MQQWQIHFLGRQTIPGGLTQFEMNRFFTFSGEERAAIFTRRGTRLRLGAAIQLGFMRLSGRSLESAESISTNLLHFLGEKLGLQVPDLASLKTLYSRRATLHAHQRWARECFGYNEFNPRRSRVLMTHLREQADHNESPDELINVAKAWLYQRKIIIPGHRKLEDMARSTLGATVSAHAALIRADLDSVTLSRWERSLLRKHEGSSRLEWLRERPQRLSPTGTRAILEKIQFLRRLGAHKYTFSGIPLTKQLAYARSASRRRPSRLMELPPEKRTLAVSCFIRVSLLQLTDTALAQFEMRSAKLIGRAAEKARAIDQQSNAELRKCIEKIRALVRDDAVDSSELRQRIKAELPNMKESQSFAAAKRDVLCEEHRRIRPMLKQLLDLPLEHADSEPLGDALKNLRKQYKNKKRSLPKDTQSPFEKVWNDKVNADDRRQAFYAYEAAALGELRKALKRGAVWSDDSLRYRENESTLIHRDEWQSKRKRHLRNLNCPASAQVMLEKLEAGIGAGLQAVADAHKEEAIRIQQGELRIPKMLAEPIVDSDVNRDLFASLGSVDLPTVMVELDAQVRYSWTLLGRPPHSENELLALYAGLLVHGTDLSLAAAERLIPGASKSTVSHIMQHLEVATRLQRANQSVVEYLRQHPIAETWGDGSSASADSMSLEASRHLWNARVDPRRRTHAVGMYTHVLDQWGIVYDQPIVLNQRQVGAAIEGVIRSKSAPGIERLAVDTHGYTDFGMALSKLLGFDLCPRLRNLKQRRLYVPKGMAVPDSIAEVCRPSIVTDTIVQEWDSLLRIAASVRSGTVSAVHAMERFGSAARGEKVLRSGRRPWAIAEDAVSL